MMKEGLYQNNGRDDGDENLDYFRFERDFIDKGIRCIPMIVRFKMDHAGIKLKLEEWTRFSTTERSRLAAMPINNKEDIVAYHNYLAGLVRSHTGKDATIMPVDPFPLWSEAGFVPTSILEKVRGLGCSIPVERWQSLTTLQRFALVKLSREGHESKNFPIALKEFGIQ